MPLFHHKVLNKHLDDRDNKFFESLFNKQLEKSEGTSKILTRERDGLVGTIVNLPSMTSELEANRKARLLNQTSQHSRNISELERFNNYLVESRRILEIL